MLLSFPGTSANCVCRRPLPEWTDEATASTKRKGLVILVNFKDVKMQDAHTRQVFDDMMNQENYSGNGNMGSVHDYFLAQSYGKFDISFDVVGPVTLPQNISYYGGNDRYGDDRRPGQMVREACKLIMDDVDFSAYDWDGDGEADQVFVICAGYSEAEGASAKYIWPHEWSLSDAGLSPLDANGIKVDTYGVSTELGEEGNTRLNGIGTACHEFSHCLGLPDMYDTDYSGAFGMDAWSLMDQGSYNGDGYAPVGYTAYERWASGWLVPQELSTPCRISEMPSIAQQPVAYVVYNDGNRNEYFLIENRQQDGWLATDESRGLMVTHVDYDEKAWYNNAVNDYKNHQRCTIVPADNISTSYTLDGDLYPYSGNNELTDESAPSARTFNANTDGSKLLGKPLTDMAISSNGLASFNFMGGVPSAIHDAGVQTMGWEAGTAVEVYDVAGHLLRKSAFSQWSLGLPHGTYLLRSGSQTQCVLH